VVVILSTHLGDIPSTSSQQPKNLYDAVNQKVLFDEGNCAWREYVGRSAIKAKNITSPAEGVPANSITFTKPNATAQDLANVEHHLFQN